MGDWMIKKFLSSTNFEKHAPLTANLIMCEKTEVPNRLKMLQDHLMASLNLKKNNEDMITQLLPAIQVFVQSVRLCAPILQSHG